jgi:4-hydroxybenzoate polyprenyltransferase
MLLGKLGVFLEMIKFEHTLFALPFAYIGALLTERQLPTLQNFFWITVAMIGARTAAMSLNRIIDRHIDAANPRTSGRALPRGLLSLSEVWLYTALSLILLALAAYQLSPLAFQLSPLVVFALTFYSYTKRFTWLCHLFLGATLGLAPLGAWVAIADRLDVAPVVLGLGVTFWVAGFDIIYASDDYDFDRRAGIYSIPARFGIRKALVIARLLHVLAAAAFLVLGRLLGLGLFYWLGVGGAVILLFWQHRLISPADLSRTGLAFFSLNGTLSVVMLLFTLLEIVLR